MELLMQDKNILKEAVLGVCQDQTPTHHLHFPMERTNNWDIKSKHV